MTQDERNELENDLKYEAYLEAQEELSMRDEEYALLKYSKELDSIYNELQAICNQLRQYGHEYTPTELISLI